MSEQDPYLALLKRQTTRAKQLSTEHLSCRRGALGHNWVAVRPDFDIAVRGALAVAFQCQSCLAIKRGVVSKRFGEWLTQPHTEYPDKYLVPREKGETGPSLSAQSVRAVFVERILADLSELPPITPLQHQPLPQPE